MTALRLDEVELDKITPRSMGLAIQRIMRPYYKGYPATPDGDPVFRRSLTGEDIQHLFTSLHHLARLSLLEQEKKQ